MMLHWLIAAAAILYVINQVGRSGAAWRMLTAVLWSLAWTLAVSGAVLLAIAPLASHPAVYVTRAALCVAPLGVARWRMRERRAQ